MVGQNGMPVEQAREEMGDIDNFCNLACVACSADAYCPSDCDMLAKARRMDYEKIVKSYARNEGDWAKVFRYIKDAKI